MVWNKWHLYAVVVHDKKKATRIKQDGPAYDIWPEIERLSKQVCPYCSGFGHAGKDCPTDGKISSLRGGTREQNLVL